MMDHDLYNSEDCDIEIKEWMAREHGKLINRIKSKENLVNRLNHIMTEFIKDISDDLEIAQQEYIDLYREGSEFLVSLRGGNIIKIYPSIELTYVEDSEEILGIYVGFNNSPTELLKVSCWDMGGSSLKNSNLDIVEIISGD